MNAAFAAPDPLVLRAAFFAFAGNQA